MFEQMAEKHSVESKGSFWNQDQNTVNSQCEPEAIKRANKQRGRLDEEQSFAYSSCPDCSGSARCDDGYVMIIFLLCWLIAVSLLNERDQK